MYNGTKTLETQAKQPPRAGRLTTGLISEHLMRLTVPMSWGILAVLIRMLADTYFIAQLGTTPLSAVSFAFPVIMVIMSLGIGLSAGASSVVARTIGANDHHEVQRRATDALTLSLVIVTVAVILGLTTIDPLFRVLGADDITMPHIRAFMEIWYWGMLFLIIPLVGNGIIRASGDARLPGFLMAVSAGLNILLDPLLIFGLGPFPRLEIRGAAVAAVLSSAVSLFGALAILHFRERLLSWRLPPPAEMWASWRNIAYISVPAALSTMINPLGMTVVTALIAQFGSEVVAGFGVATRLEGIASVGLLALSAGIGPVVGQNWGAGLKTRVAEALSVSAKFCVIYGLAIALLLAIAAPLLTPLFDDSELVQQVATHYLWLVPISYAGYGLTITVSAAFNALGRPLLAMSLTFARMAFLYLPLAWLGAALFAYLGVFVAAVIANITAGAAAYLWANSVCRQQNSV